MTGRHRPRRDLPLRHRLLLDPAALLGARADQAGRLRPRRHPDDAGGAGRGADQVRDAGLHPDPAAAHHPAGRSSARWARSTRWRPRCSARGCSGTASGCAGSTAVTPVAWGMYRYSLLYLALLFVAMGVDRALPFGGPGAPHEVIILDQAIAERVRRRSLDSSHGPLTPTGHRTALGIAVRRCERRARPPHRAAGSLRRGGCSACSRWSGRTAAARAGDPRAARRARAARSRSRWWCATCSTPPS